MTPFDPTQLHLGDVVQLRKKHPCGGVAWQITRLGADIGLTCLTCQRKILIPRSQLLKQVKTLIPHSP